MEVIMWSAVGSNRAIHT